MNEPGKISFGVLSSQLLDSLLRAFDDKNALTLLTPSDVESAGFLIEPIKEALNNAPLKSVLRIARVRYKCFGLVEHPYFDLEEWGNYAAFYARAFQPFERICRRLHFFEGDDHFADKLVNRLSSGIQTRDLEELLKDRGLRYRGFVVIRPSRNFPIGRTAIEFDDRDPKDTAHFDRHTLEATGYPFCTTKIKNAAHIGGSELVVEAPPAIQQLPVTGMCATASTWVSSQIMSARHGLHKFPYATITRQAAGPEILGAGTDHRLGKGLTWDQIRMALSITGATPLVILGDPAPGVSLPAQMRLLAYTFVESGLPVIACYSGSTKRPQRPGHAVTLVGHLLPATEHSNEAAENRAELVFPKVQAGRHHLVGQAVQLYYAHNDNYGPFDRLRFLTDAECQKTVNKDQSHVCRGRDDDETSLLRCLLTVLPPYVQNTPLDVIRHALISFDKIWEKDQNNEEGFQVLWRFLLAKSSDFKRSVISRQPGLPDEVKRWYLSLHLPLYIWLAEFSIVPSDQSLPFHPDQRKISGELLFDSTTPYYDPSCLSMRIGGVVLENKSNSQVRLANNVETECFRA